MRIPLRLFLSLRQGLCTVLRILAQTWGRARECRARRVLGHRSVSPNQSQWWGLTRFPWWLLVLLSLSLQEQSRTLPLLPMTWHPQGVLFQIERSFPVFYTLHVELRFAA